MRSIIEEIAAAEQQADEIRGEAAAEARERLAKASEAAEHAAALLEADEREAQKAALAKAEQEGEALAKTLTEAMSSEADALCREAERRLDDAVAYLMKKVQKLA